VTGTKSVHQSRRWALFNYLIKKEIEVTITWKNHLIKSYEYGYVTQKRVGKQWRAIGYYSTLKQAVNDLFQHRVLTETTDHIVDATNKASIQLQSAHILQKIDQIASEISEGLNYDSK
jgi:hypothetical protein